TTISKEAQPLVRYRTRDITSINVIPCKCGRTHRRIARIQGRSDDMLIIRGVNVFPQQIEAILLETQGVAPHYQLILTREGSLDMLEVKVEIDEKLFSDEIRHLQRVEATIRKNIKEFLGVTAKVTLSEPQSIERSEGKAKRIVDLRNG
ncbi:MAG: phenylacetate--CoA ligase, partial [Desulfovibrionales bacterium]|nr:phenylacetate--CoA ligase [Desulfovibrionales bacterium]